MESLLALLPFLVLLMLGYLVFKPRLEKADYCYHCHRSVAVKRHIGTASMFASLFTLGVWYVLVIPFYKKRCFICGSDNVGQGRAIMIQERKLEQIRQQEKALDELVRQRKNRGQYTF